ILRRSARYRPLPNRNPVGVGLPRPTRRPVRFRTVTYPTGEQYEIKSGDHAAVITEVGATLRSYRVAGRDVVRGFAAEEPVHLGRGQQLLPWPNRIRDGRYPF